MPYLRGSKLALLRLCRLGGAFSLARRSQWRRQRLLILCYHGISTTYEHQWNPYLYISSRLLSQRLAAIRDSGLSVLRFDEAFTALSRGELDEPAVTITFDDGFHDFYRQAVPLLREFNFPATVYLTTYYAGRRRPIFNLISDYMLWLRRESGATLGSNFGLPDGFTLRGSDDWRHAALAVQRFSEQHGLGGEEKDDTARQLATSLGLDYDEIVGSRLLQLMSEEEVRKLAQQGFDFQLHTHRHRTPQDECLFKREIQENSNRIEALTGRKPVHFCYPSGIYEPSFLPWLRQLGVHTATTCDPGLATPETEPLLLPRKLDTSFVTPIEFEAWLSGFEPLLQPVFRLVPHE